MKEQLISFETAKLAKEKGFNLNSGRFYYVYDYKELVHEKDNEYNIRHPDYKDRFTAVPTQSLLQKWLREVHKIHITVYCMEKSLENGWETYFDIHLKQQTKMNALQSIAGKAREFNTYEQALEVGLQEALKLIK